MFTKIVVPLDSSRNAELVLPFVLEIASAFGSQLHLIQVLSDDSSENGANGIHYLSNIENSLHNELKKRNAARPVSVFRHILTGNPAGNILRFTDDNQIDLIALTNYGVSGEGAWAMGSVAYKIIQAGKQSVLVVKKPAAGIINVKPQIKKLLVPLDGSTTGEAAIPSAQAIADSMNAELVLMRVVVPSSMQRDSFLSYTTEVLEELIKQAEKGQEERKTAAQSYLEQVKEKLAQDGISASGVVKLGYPPEQLFNYAETAGIDLIVMSSHGRSGISRWMMGSVTEKMLETGNTPILVVRAKSR